MEGKLFVVVLIERDDCDSPQIKIVKAANEDEAYDKFAELIGHTPESMFEGEEMGEIVIVVKECVESN